MYNWSDEQLEYFKALQIAINQETPQLLKIQAVAGASKSTSTVEAVKRVHQENPNLSIRYCVFNSAMALEAKTAFGTTAIASTLHALAYHYTVKPYKLNPDIAPWLTYKDIPASIKVPFGSLPLILQTLNDYFESGYTDFQSFIANEVDIPEWTMLVYMAANLILDAMATGKMRITHAFYLKLFHILVKLGHIKLKPEDILIVDECLAGDQRIKLSDSCKKISVVYNNFTKGVQQYVKSFNHTTNTYEDKLITNAVCTGVKPTYKVKTEGLSTIVCTDNHKLFTQRGYVEVKDIIIGKDYVIQDLPENQKCKRVLSELQLQVVLGSYLGDGGLAQCSEFNTYRLNFTQGEKQLDYLLDKLKCFSLPKPRLTKSGYTGKFSIYQSNYTSTFVLEDNPFNLVISKIDARGLAIWLMDDGSYCSRSQTIIIHSNNLTKEQNIELANLLNSKFGIEAKVRKCKQFYEIYFSKKATNILRQLVARYIHPIFFDKFKVSNTGFSWKSEYEPYGANYISSITYLKDQETYDITVEDNHNFFTGNSNNNSGMLVHNCQDLNLITLDVFNLYPAKVKVIIGDQAQSIYHFMGCVSAFDFYKNQGTTYHLSTSFRVSTHIAQSVEQFCQTHIAPDMKFLGIEYTNPQVKTHAYIFRTNLAMIRQMIQLNKSRTPYKLVTKQKVKQLFELPLALIYATPGHTQFSEHLKVIQHTIDKWGKIPDHIKPAKLTYLANELNEVPAISQAIKFIMAVGPEEIVDAYKHAEEHMKAHSNLYLMTSHTSKGLSLDEVTIDDSMNNSIEEILRLSIDERSAEEQSEVFNYYVACTRARYKLNNAKHLPKPEIEDEFNKAINDNLKRFLQEEIEI